MIEISLLFAGAFLAGLIDAVVGGGGLVQIPLLFGAFPGSGAATVFGTNKLSSIFGTAAATAQYSRRVAVPWQVVLPAAFAAFVFAYLGAMAVSEVPLAILKPIVLVLLVLVAGYTWVRKDFGRSEKRAKQGGQARLWAIGIGAGIGFYDGFFGPGTGSFLIFLFVRVFGMDFLRASASAKVVNVTTNLSALLCFGSAAAILWQVGFAMAVFNVFGAVVGSRLALRHGPGFVRALFLLVVSVLIARFAWDVLHG